MRGIALASKIVVAGLAGAYLAVSAVHAPPARPASDVDAYRETPVGGPSTPGAPPTSPSQAPSAAASGRP